MSSKKSIGEPATERSSNQARKKKVELDLPEILAGELRKEAEDECRTLEQHMLYILKNRFRVLRETRIVPNIAPIAEHCAYKRFGGSQLSVPQSFHLGKHKYNWDGSPIVTC